MLYNSSLGNEIEDTLSKKMEKYKRGFSGGMLMNRKLQSITEEDEKSVVNSMRKKKEDETNKETEQQFNIKVIETQSRNKEKGKDSERVKIIKSNLFNIYINVFFISFIICLSNRTRREEMRSLPFCFNYDLNYFVYKSAYPFPTSFKNSCHSESL